MVVLGGRFGMQRYQSALSPLPPRNICCMVFSGVRRNELTDYSSSDYNSALMFYGVRRDELTDYSSFDDNEGCRSRTWLFLAYVVAFTSLAGSVGMLVQDALLPTFPSTWTGIAGVLQCFFCLASGLMFRTSRTTLDH